MDELVLTAKELMYAAAQLGAVRFFGLPDPFYGMQPEDIQREVGEIRLSLEKKGYARLGFDDTFELRAEVKGLLETAALCERYVMLRRETHDAPALTEVLYCKQGRRVLLRQEPRQLTLTEVTAQTIPEGIAREFEETCGNDVPGEAVLLSEETLTAAQKLAADAPEQAKTLLAEQGCDAQAAALLVQGFRRETAYCVLCEGDLKLRTLRHLIVIGREGDRVSLVPEDLDERLWSVRPGVDASVVQQLLTGKEEVV